MAFTKGKHHDERRQAREDKRNKEQLPPKKPQLVLKSGEIVDGSLTTSTMRPAKPKIGKVLQDAYDGLIYACTGCHTAYDKACKTCPVQRARDEITQSGYLTGMPVSDNL